MINQQQIELTAERKKLISILVLLKETWNLYRNYLGVLIGIMLVPTVIGLIGAIFSAYGKAGAGGPIVAAIIVILGIILMVGKVIISFSSLLASLYAIKERTGISESYRWAARNFFSYAWISILAMLIVMGGFVMGIIPGLIFSVWFVFAVYIFVVENQRGFSALLKSKEYARGYWWPIFGRTLISTLISLIVYAILLLTLLLNKIAGEIIVYIVQIFLTPFLVVYLYQLYKNLTEIKPELAMTVVVNKKGFFIFSAALGFVVLVVLPIVIIGLAKIRSNAQKIINQQRSEVRY